MEAKTREQCKIRKRGNSSSSSSSVINKYRFKRAILVGKRGGSTTPVPIWKTTTIKSPSLTMPNAESTKCPGGKSTEASVSARKLAATLWEINTVNSPNSEEIKHHRNRDKVEKLPHLSDPSYTLISEKMDRSRGNCVSNSNLMEIETYSKAKSRRGCMKTRLKDVSNGLKASKELLKVLNRISGIDEQNASAMSLVSALGVELDRARIQVNQLIKEEHSHCNDFEYFLKQFEEEKAAWKSKERERIRNAIGCIAEELEVEKKLRRQTERLNKKLGKELGDAKECLSRVSKELEGEKRAKEILEQVCDELAKGIGEDRAQVEELKRESLKVREEVEKERQMLQLADVLREERVQMKLSDAKYHFEEKNAAVERLRDEFEAYLRQKVEGKENGDVGSPNYERIKELEAYLTEIQDVSCQKADIKLYENEEVCDGDGDDSADSDLHSIELNMDNSSRSYKWSYVNDIDNLDNVRRVSVDRDFKGRKSISENIQWGSICLQRMNNSHNVDGPDWDFISKNQGKNSDDFDNEQLLESDTHSRAKDDEDEKVQRKSVKGLRDHILSNAQRQQMQHFASPTKQWGHTILPLQDNGAVSDSSRIQNSLTRGVWGCSFSESYTAPSVF
ncbi:uncharacterized protein At5g41620 isoform X2 [Euphorbia lathyris]|uniref:uncharacterized protein At5g41620 isoform X2 n=1 Tax=Euphorbia lathyris TaxID=212925 RepID=UPI0033139DCE